MMRIHHQQEEEPASSSTRQVAKVTPFMESGGNNEPLDCPADPMTATGSDMPNAGPIVIDSPDDTVASAVSEPKPATLRLRNFAVDPSSNVSSSSAADAPSPSVTAPASLSSSSWHLAQGQPEPPPQQPNAESGKVTSFPEAVSKFLKLTFVLTATDRHQVANYSILGSTGN